MTIATDFLTHDLTVAFRSVSWNHCSDLCSFTRQYRQQTAWFRRFIRYSFLSTVD
jgi:hypothetical protein